ncbi:D-alanine--D-alanine ligase [Campylobacter sp. 19-13652]|uniref:D-alanine--D-alanine ligase n=1 Tax=Campylobacter sp. 19-13652 TaxID=2840180 RepID=UPI001C75324E|nr:D-alanine--D-alanine ligase [Campylobacter sp. 19-13652]BCX79472.1 D-alanine--D-alanine ligase [Campylobacter sp. 19-13652]
MKYGVIFGAKSFEHEISIVSAVVLKGLLPSAVFVFCDANREFYLIPNEKLRANFFTKWEYKKCVKLSLENGGFYAKKLLGKEKIEADVFINLIHGADGEDGKMAGLLEFFGIKFIGPRLEASVLSYSKYLTKLLASSVGVKSLEYEVIYKGQKPTMSFPIILKPLHLGSSIGVSVVKEQSELEYALDVAFEFDDAVLVEPFISGVKEYNLAGAMVNNEIVYSIIEEPSKKEFLDYEQKYISFSAESNVREAELSDEIVNKFKDAFTRVYKSGFKGAIIRCDFFLVENEVYLNEINPNPGSLANYLFKDFLGLLDGVANSLPNEMDINIDYKFINTITHAKGSPKLS